MSKLWKELYKIDINLLVYIASESRLYNSLNTTTTKIASDFGISQQSVSRKLSEFKDKELIKKQVTNNGIIIRLTPEAISLLKETSKQFSNLFDSGLTLEGNLIKGLGEARYYMNKQGYKISFNKIVGYVPWPGTFNIKLKPPLTRRILDNFNPINIPGFKEKNRTFGKIKCFPCTIYDNKNIKTHLILPERSSHDKDIIEVIAPVYLRKTLNKKENDKIKIKLF